MNDTRIVEIKHIPAGEWHQYDIKLNFNYGWGYMLKSAANLAVHDLLEVDSFAIADTNGNATELIEKLKAVNNDASKVAELQHESAALSLAGTSGELKLPTKVIWFNQTQVMRVFVIMEMPDEDLRNFISKYILLT